MSSLGLVLSICFGDSRNSPPFSFLFGSLQRPISSLRRLSLTSIPAFELVGLAICIPCSASAIRMASSDQRSNHSALHRCRPETHPREDSHRRRTFFLIILDWKARPAPRSHLFFPIVFRDRIQVAPGLRILPDFARFCRANYLILFGVRVRDGTH